MNKKVFLGLIIILFILICIVSVLLIKLKDNDIKNDEQYNPNTNQYIQNEGNKNNTAVNEEISNVEEIEESVTNIYTKAELLNVKQCIDLFLYQCSVKAYNDTENKKIYNMLDKEYINIYEVSIENVLSEYYDDFEYVIKSMYKLNLDAKVDLYIIYGSLFNINDESKQDKSFMIKMDKTNLKFSMFLDNYIMDNSYLENNILEKKISDFNFSKEIENNITNTYKIEEYETMDYISYYFNIYKIYLKYDNESLYTILNPEYREKRFGNIENMKTFINDNKSKLENQMIFKYLEDEYENYIYYICIDGSGRYYIIQVDNLNNFTMYLDNYTTFLPEFLENYNEGDSELKVKRCINRFFEAITVNDYEYAYGKLDDTFKAQYFPTTQEFENYAKNTFVYDEEIEYNEFSDLEGTYTYVVELENGENIIEKTFEVQLLEGTDYKLSFNI